MVRVAAESNTPPAEPDGVTDAYVCRLLPLTSFSPDIVEAILDGRQPKGLKLVEQLALPSPMLPRKPLLNGLAVDAAKYAPFRHCRVRVVLAVEETLDADSRGLALPSCSARVRNFAHLRPSRIRWWAKSGGTGEVR